MTTSPVKPPAARAMDVASLLLRPAPILFSVATVAIVGSLLGYQWAVALFWAMILLIGAVTAGVLAGARPLPRLADRSHLLHRISWLGRYGAAALLLCVSTFLGGVAGTGVAGHSVSETSEMLMSLINEVGVYAVQVAVVIFLGWLAIDVWRLGNSGRVEGFERAFNRVAGAEFAGLAREPVVVRWMLALTSPVLVSLTAFVGIVAMLMSVSALAP